MKTIKLHKGVLYFPTLEAVKGFAIHCGLTNVRFSTSLHGWAIAVPKTK